jgi:hypothetical protein
MNCNQEKNTRAMLKTTFFRTAIAIGCLLTISGVASADTKVKSRQTMGGQTYENTSLIKGKRQRTETNNGQMIVIQQCDLRRNIQIMPQAQAYMIQPYDQPAGANSAAPNPATPGSQPTAVKKGGLVTSTVTTRDTGERKQMFGYTARHIITTMETKSSPDACSQQNTKMEIDGWYIDAAFALDCDSSRAYTNYRPQANGGCQDRYETKQVGNAKQGYPVWQKTTMFGPNGAESFSSINEVIEFSQATLDPSLFDVPAGYREVQDFASAFSANAATSEPANTSNPNPGATSNPTSATTQPVNTAAEVGKKREGVIRIGVAAVKTGNLGEGLNANDVALAVQNALMQSLKTGNVEAVPIQAKLQSAIDAEAQQKECDYVVYSNVAHKKGGGGGFGSVFGSSAASVVGSAIGHGAGTAAAITTNAVVSASITENIKAKDELTLDVRLESPGSGTPAFTKQYKGKAKSAGEDIISPVVAQAAQGVVGFAAKP